MKATLIVEISASVNSRMRKSFKYTCLFCSFINQILHQNKTKGFEVHDATGFKLLDVKLSL